MISHRTLPGALIESLRGRIVSGQLRTGGRIDQDALAKEFGVSRMPVREALRQLDAEGFVTLVPHRGAIVSKLESAELQQIYEMRAVLEGLACRFALPHLSPADVVAMREAVEAMSEATDSREWTRLNGVFHERISERCERTLLLATIERLRRQCQPYVHLYLHLLRGEMQADLEHRRICEAVAAGDGEAVERLVRAHLEGAGRIVARCLAAKSTTNEEELE